MAARLSACLAGFLLGLPAVLAQTTTDCNPLTASCPSDAGLAQSTYSVDFTKGGDDANWAPLNQWTGGVVYGANGAEFTIHKKGDSPTIISNWYLFFGRVEIHMRSSWGTGIVSSAVLESDDLDEVDWEFIGGDDANVQTNYFGKGDTSTYDRGGKSPVADAQGVSHNYTLLWTTQAITWYVDGVSMRTLNYGDAKGGAEFPQTPMRLRLGIWAGGDSGNAPGTIEWAGGQTDYSKAPFSMYVQSVSVTNFNPSKSYTYGDHSGSWQSIKFDGTVSNPPPPASSSTTTTTTTPPPATSMSTSTTSNPITTSSSTVSLPSSAANNSGAPQFATQQPNNNTVSSSTTSSSAPSSTTSTATTPSNAAGLVSVKSSLLMAAPLALGALFL